MKLIFGLHVATTLFMTGIIWFVQLVHYPLFAAVGTADFTTYESLHRIATSRLVAPLMVCELGTGLWLWLQRPTWLPAWLVWLGGALILIIWGSTFFVQVPLHDRLLEGQATESIRLLVRSNWIRTISWSVRSVLLGLICWRIWPMS